MQIIDLSLPLEFACSEPEPVSIEWIDHRQGASMLLKEEPHQFPEGLGLSLERICMTSHSGTHVDAPIHYGPDARTIDEMPLNWFFGEGFMLDCSQGPQDEVIRLNELQNALKNQGLNLNPNDIVLISTGADKLWGTQEYFTHFRGMNREGTFWLLDQGIRVIGIDSFGFDAPFHRMIAEFRQTRNREALWPCHMLGREREYCQIERLANLSDLPKSKKFKISCFPIKLKNCGAAQTRAVALL